MFVRRTARSLAALSVSLVLGAGALAGCSDGEAKPAPAPTTSDSPSPTDTSSEPVEPTLPAEAQGDDAAAAEAFVRHYYEALNYAQATGDVEYLKSLGLESCDVCTGVADRLAEIHDQGGRIDGGEFAVRRSRAGLYDSAPNQPRVTVVHVQVHNTAQRIIGGPKDLPTALPAGTSRAQFLTAKGADGWQIAEWEPVQ